MIKFDELEKYDFSSLSLTNKVNAFFKGNEVIADFAKKVIISVLKGQLSLNDKEKAIVGTYYRMYAWMCSLITMNNLLHFQGAAVAARSLFELLIDLKIISDDETGEMVEKFHAFSEVERFHVAEKAVNFFNTNKKNVNINVTHQQLLVNKLGRKQYIEQLVIKYWGLTKKGKPNYPDHWTGRDIRRRAHNLGLHYEEIYIELYPILSWYTHSGSAGYAGLDSKALEACFGLCHSTAQYLFLEGTLICAKIMKISKAIEDFNDMIDNLKIAMGKFFIEEKIKVLEKENQKLNKK